jgi:aspartyl-tRNA(Asn)/glutamyl-tRNA(Gln) amidotransferase subunit A
MLRSIRDWTADEPGPDGGRAGRLKRARRLDATLNAFVALREPALLPDGPLTGVPYAAKDIVAAPDRTPCGGLSAPLAPLGCDYADVLAALDGAGADRIGYTALTEIAYEPSGYNATRGRVRNPWNPEFISGGSSSGSAAAVASGTVVIALGSDTGGSLRIPAHACGVTAWKPTWGAVSARGAMPLAPTLDTIGLMARSAADLMPAAHVLARLDDGKPVGTAVVLRDALEDAEPSVRKACQDGIDALRACGVAIGHRDGMAAIEAADPPVLTVMQGEAARCHRGLIDDAGVSPVLRRRLAKGLDVDDAALARAAAQRAPLAAVFAERVLQSADVALLPVMTIRTPLAAVCDPRDKTFSPRTLYELSRLTRFVNMLGFPAVALPVGFDDRGLPVALQIVGRPGTDHSLLALAAAMQRRTDWHGRRPTGVTA